MLPTAMGPPHRAPRSNENMHDLSAEPATFVKAQSAMSATRVRDRSTSRPRAAFRAYFALVFAAVISWMWLGRGTTFLADEWDFVLAHNQHLWSAVVAPYHGQFDAVPVLVYRAMFALFGIGHYWPYRLVGIVFMVAMSSVTFAYLCRRLPPFLALVATGLIMANGQGWEDILWPFELTFTISLATGVGALMLLDRGDRAGQALAALCLLVSVASSGFGLAFLTGVGAEAAWSAWAGRARIGPHNRRRSSLLWQAWVIAPALSLYLAWSIHGHVHDAVLSEVRQIPHYVARSAGYGIAHLIGLHSPLVGEVLAALVALVLGTRLVLDWRSGARLAMCGAAALSYWALLALGRSNLDPNTSRYLLPDSLFMVLALAELGDLAWAARFRATRARWYKSPSATASDLSPVAAGERVPARRAWAHGSRAKVPGASTTQRSTPLLAGAAPLWAPPSKAKTMLTKISVVTITAVATLGVVSNSKALVHASDWLRSMAVTVRADLRAVELAKDNLPTDFVPLPKDAFEITVGPYLSAVAALGSPADTTSQLLAAPEAVRESADQILVTALKLAVRPIGYLSKGQGAGSVPSCSESEERSPVRAAHLILYLKWPAFLVVAPSHSAVEVRLRLLASHFPGPPNVRVPAGTTSIVLARKTIGLPLRPWAVQLTVEGRGTTAACALGT